MNKTQRIFIKDLNNNDEFVFPGRNTVCVCTFRRTQDNMTRIHYRLKNVPDMEGAVTRVNLSTVDLLV